MSIADKITRLQNAGSYIRAAITAKGGSVTSGDGFEDFPDAIGTIPTGIVPSGTTNITQNGTYDVSTFANAVVNVESSPSLELVVETDIPLYRDYTSTTTPATVTTLSNDLFVNKFNADDLYIINFMALSDVPVATQNFNQKFSIAKFSIVNNLPANPAGSYVGLGFGFNNSKYNIAGRYGLSYIPDNNGNQIIYAMANYATFEAVRAGTYKLRIWKLPSLS